MTDKDCRPIQRQGLLQWGWDSSKLYTPEQVNMNATRLSKETGSTLVSVAKEMYEQTILNKW